MQIGKCFHNFGGRHQIAGSGIRVNKGNGFALKIFNAVDFAVILLGNKYGMVNSLRFIAVRGFHNNRRYACTFSAHGNCQSAHICHIGLAGAQRFNNGGIIACLNFLNFHVNYFAKVFGKSASGIGAVRSRFVRSISNGKGFLFGLLAVAAAACCKTAKSYHGRQ